MLKMKIFLKINNSYIAETVNRVTDVDRDNPVVNVVMAADAELTMYMKHLQLSVREMMEHCSLTWWKYN